MISERYGAIVPFIRPAGISDDQTPTVPVISHAVKEIDVLYGYVEFACCIYPCSPLLLTSDLIEAFNMLQSTKADFVYPVVEYPHPIFRSMRKSKNGKMEFVYPEHELTRTQDLENVFHDAGQFYFTKTADLLRDKKLFTDFTISFEIPASEAQDIDTEEDWRIAEIKYTFYLDRLKKSSERS